MKLIITMGLPGSGKSYWAKQQVLKSGGNTKRLNKDLMREMLDAGKWSKNNEKLILKLRDELIGKFLYDGYSVIVDDTNLAPKHEETLKQIAKKFSATFEVKDFTDVPIETCIKRDLQRLESVGESVIRKMYNDYLRPKVTYTPPEGKPKALLVDVDGTIAKMTDRSPYDWDRVKEDTVNEPVADIVRKLSKDYIIIIMSGRDSSCYNLTEEWLDENDIPFDYIYMRAEGDTRKDSIVKKELFEQHIKDNYDIQFVLDDRKQVVETWRNELGLTVLQVDEGDF